jgi:hypothetical protein
MSGDKQRQPLFQSTPATMLVSRADVCPSEGEQRRKTSCNIAMPCGSYCLKKAANPEATKPSIAKEWH